MSEFLTVPFIHAILFRCLSFLQQLSRPLSSSWIFYVPISISPTTPLSMNFWFATSTRSQGRPFFSFFPAAPRSRRSREPHPCSSVPAVGLYMLILSWPNLHFSSREDCMNFSLIFSSETYATPAPKFFVRSYLSLFRPP